MSIDAFILWYKFEDLPFTTAFLASSDFDIQALKQICQTSNMSSSGHKSDLASRLANFSHYERVQQAILESLIYRNKKWFSLKIGKVTRFPACSDPKILVIQEGNEEWYGPITPTFDNGARWYIRPVFIPHWSLPPKIASTEVEGFSNKPDKFFIRWLCFARLTDSTISLHWRSFSHSDDVKSVNKQNSQFRYWEYIPPLFEEIEQLTNSRLRYINLHGIILQELWDTYRYDTDYFIWHDHRIRAESGGVSLSARAAVGGVELDVKGIHRLARTVRRAIELELQSHHYTTLPEPEKFDEVILKTLIQDFGALSYEFSLDDKQGNTLFHGHSYFGSKPHQSSADAFPHVNLHIAKNDDLEQMRFLLNHQKTYDEKASRHTQFSLF